MATRSEQFRTEAQRHARKESANKRASRSKPGSPAAKVTRTKKSAGRKATYALEPSGEQRPSRKSTRKSANRSKPDTNLTLREGRAKGSPTERARKAKAKRARARGSSAQRRVTGRGKTSRAVSG